MHKYAGVDADYILVETRHCVPPILLDVVFELHAHLAIVIDCRQAVVDVTGREDETVFLAVGDEHLE